MALVAVEALRLRLAAVAHVFVFDGDPSVFGDTFADAEPATAWVGLKILGDELPEGVDMVLEQRALHLFG